MLWKCLTQYTSKFGKLSSGHRTGKGQFSFQSQRKAMPLPHNCTHLTLAKWCSKFSKPDLKQYMNRVLPDVQMDLENAEEPEIKLPTSAGSSKKQESSIKKTYLFYWLCQSLWLCGSQINCGKFWKRWAYQTTWPASWKICMQIKK